MVEVDVEIPMELVVYGSNPYEFDSVVLMIQRASVGKFYRIGIIQKPYEIITIQSGPQLLGLDFLVHLV